MKLSIPDEFKTPFAMLMKGLPEELQEDEQFKDAALVYLKFGGIRLARQYVETRKNFMGFDPLEVDTGFRFPRLQEIESEEEGKDEGDDDTDDADETDDPDETDDADKTDGADEKTGDEIVETKDKNDN